MHTVKLFAALRDLAGASAIEIELPANATARDLLARVRETLPSASSLLERCAVAINLEYSKPDASIREGDELAIIPPVSGG
jgi:molybdopterin converting factor subunit 1